MMMPKHIALTLALTVAGCAAQSLNTPLPVNHPANPAAPEAPAVPASTTLDDDPLAPPGQTEEAVLPGAGHHHPNQHGQAVVESSYRCPMHPDVRSDQPGRCPVCGMQLMRDGQ